MKEIEELRYGERYNMFDEEIISHMLGSCGRNVSIKPRFYCYMGVNIHVGNAVCVIEYIDND